MMQETTQITHLTSNLLERTALLIKMENTPLEFCWLGEFANQEIADCCSRIESFLSGIPVPERNLQRELLRNPLFAEYYAKLLPLFPAEPPSNPEPAPTHAYARHRYQNYPSRPRPAAPNRRRDLKQRLSNLLESAWEQEINLTDYSQQDLMEVLERDSLDRWTRLVYLVNFTSKALSGASKQAVIRSMGICQELPLHLDDYQKNLLEEPYVLSRYVFEAEDFTSICELLKSCPHLVKIIQLLHDHKIDEELCLADYRIFMEEISERIALMTSTAASLGPDNFCQFIVSWKRSQYSMEELERVVHIISDQPDQNWDAVFANYSGYVNLLYGNRFKTIDLSNAASYQVDILAYAIIHNKKHFIQLVDEHADVFLNLPRNSILLQEDIYTQHLNLNDLTVKQLEACQWMRVSNLDPCKLLPGRCYTFLELTVLYDTPDIYITLYNLLDSKSLDYRLRVFRQLRKRNVLKSFAPEDIERLADKLKIKPLYDWKEQEFGHISGLTAEDTANLLVSFEEIQHLLPSIYHRTDAVLALKNKNFLDQVACMEELRSHIIQIDAEWCALIEEMGLSEEFLARYRDNILKFLCSNGAYIVRKYAECLGQKMQEAFYRVVKAELMGQLDVLKYFEGDLQRELDMPLTAQIKDGWKRNLSVTEGGMEVQEYDDFFSTMLLGTQPQRTCLDYADGMYRECLLSSFDSNKKVLYVSLDGKIVGRAFLRLTKGRLTGSAKSSSSTLSFVDVENIAAESQNIQPPPEYPTLFLERAYVSGISGTREAEVENLLITLACAKAKELGTMLILSLDYDPSTEDFACTRFDVFISKSKAGAQYLDSLSGEATTSAEGSYKTNSFLVKSDFLVGE